LAEKVAGRICGGLRKVRRGSLEVVWVVWAVWAEHDVLDVSDSGVQCWWFDKSGKLHGKVFPDEVLVKAASSNLAIQINLR